MYKNGTQRGQQQWRCPIKNKEKNQEYYRNNREKVLAQTKKYAMENKERKNEVNKKWRKENLHKTREWDKIWRKNNPSKVYLHQIRSDIRRKRARLENIT
jgi:hypothetical protein